MTDVVRIFRHLKQDLGFHEVGFAPVTTSPDRLYSINDKKAWTRVLEQFQHSSLRSGSIMLCAGQMRKVSNVSDTISELYQGVNKSHPCGAGLGLLGVGPSGDIAPCHRFVDSDAHALGHISTGINSAKRNDFLSRGHINSKYDCHAPLRPVTLRGRVSSRSVRSLRRYRASQSPLLRLDSRLDRYLSSHLRHHQRAEPWFS